MNDSQRAVAILLAFVFFPAANVCAQQTPHEPKQVQARLKSAQKPTSNPADEAMSTILRTRRFQQTAVSPDGKHVAWVETVIAKSGAPSGDTTIFVVPIGGN